MLNKVKKSLGQNFLQDKNIINYITDAVNIDEASNIIEIGPGTGNLTEALITKNPKSLTVIEKDRDLSNLLNSKFNDKIRVINNDFLNINLEKISPLNAIIFGNLPYNVSTQILIKLIRDLNIKNGYKKMVLMFQREVADRIIAKCNTNNYGRLAVIAQLKFNIKKLKNISPNSFYPIPKVESSVLLFEKKNEIFKIKNIKNLEHVTNIFFNLRRKMIKKPFQILFDDPIDLAKKLQINLNYRPQKIEPKMFYEICAEYEKLIS